MARGQILDEFEARQAERVDLLLSKLEHTSHFIGARSDYDSANAVIIGFPMDFTVSFRAGSRMGPRRIRDMSMCLEEYSWHQEATILGRNYYDMGDLVLPFGNAHDALTEIGEAASVLLDDGKFILGLGGEHLVTLPLVQQWVARVPDLVVVQFDAHADLREDYMGQTASHAAVMRRICEEVGAANVYQFGVRSGSREELEWGKVNTHLFMDELVPALQRSLPDIQGRPLFLTIDIDVADPAFAPGTGTPESGGPSARELIEALHLLKDCKVVSMDIVEVSPPYDHGDITSLLAAKLVREALLQWT